MDKEAGRIKTTVLKCFDTKEVFEDPPIKTKYSGPCLIFKEGQAFYVDDSMPSGLCPFAWDVMFLAVITLKFDGNFLEWYDEPGAVVTCCPDGLRPVIFKLERK